MDNGQNQSTTSGEERKNNPRLAQSAEDTLTELSKSLKAVNFYPRSHPTLLNNLERANRLLTTTMGDGEQLAFGITNHGFTLGTDSVSPGNQGLQDFAKEMYLRQIKKIYFLKGVSLQEIESFLRVIAMEEEVFRGKGKAEHYLNEAGVSHIWANEINLGQSQGIQRKEEAPLEAEQIDDYLQRLIDSLANETDAKKYLQISREASIAASRFRDEQKFEAAFMILRAFWRNFSSEPPKANMIVEASKSAYREIAVGPLLDFILRQLTLLDGPRKDEVYTVASALGDELFKAILDKLATNEALYSHRALIQVLLSNPDLVRKAIEARLDDPRWWVSRKMAFLLGEIKMHNSIQSLLLMSAHPDLRVRKEVLKALSKIKTQDCIKKLIEILESRESDEIKIYVARLVSEAGERSAVPSLIKILKGRGTMLDDSELLEECIKSLGKIGSPQAVPVLSEIMLKRSIFAKAKSINLGVEAASSLGTIGGADAEKALAKGAKDKQSEIKLAASKALTAKQTQPKQQGSETQGAQGEN